MRDYEYIGTAFYCKECKTFHIDAKKEDYYKYLHSKEWKELRLRRIEYDKYTCQKCGERIIKPYGKGLQVHHKSYKNLKTENEILDLITLCTKCHKINHNKRWN